MYQRVLGERLSVGAYALRISEQMNSRKMRFKAFALLNTEKTQQMKLKILMWHFAQYSSPSIPSRKRNFLLNEKTLNCCEEREREARNEAMC